ncbi:I INOSITOL POLYPHOSPHATE 5-PHOSPHATASE putative-RELATED [Salix purpurea]|uniref:I INOSITOL POLYPHOSPHATE 5-PHOSPHATASE putative-RELATED n=1 Tax=Salix purpurea TaxID=77065 RepID=A0A9Q0W414_SALPP|nr:I INOSITOL POLYPHOSPHATE 5-PHOSPHATASE putative-RELATED [Salix purpurea]
MWAKLVANKFLRKVLGSNNIVADFPNSSETMFEPEESSGASSSGQASRISSGKHIADHDQGKHKIFVGSWNVGGVAPPDDLNMEEWLCTHTDPADIYVLGFQEVVPLNAGNIVLGFENRKICCRWNSLIREALNNSISKHVHEEDKVGESYKGSVSVRFCLHETSFCFVCSHLASGGKEGDENNRNSNAAEILSRTRFSRGPLRNLPSKILDHDQVIWLGDLNYRIYLPHTTTRSLVQKKEWNTLLERDQLKVELMEGHVFQGWREGMIEFAPTYKYYQNSQVYYGCDKKRKGEKKRAPAWCDRIIWFGEGLKQKEYSRGESRLSDHRPVRAIFVSEIEAPSNPRRLGRFNCLKDHLEECFNEKVPCNVRTSFYSE